MTKTTKRGIVIALIILAIGIGAFLLVRAARRGRAQQPERRRRSFLRRREQEYPDEEVVDDPFQEDDNNYYPPSGGGNAFTRFVDSFVSPPVVVANNSAPQAPAPFRRPPIVSRRPVQTSYRAPGAGTKSVRPPIPTRKR